MAKLDKLKELNSVTEQNIRHRLEDKLRKQEYYDDIEELFDPLTKILNTNGKAWRAHNETSKLFKTKDW